MEHERLDQLFEELDGMVDLGLAQESLTLCKVILREAEYIDGVDFTHLSSAIGMFSEDCPAWLELMEKRFSALSDAEKKEAISFWVLFLASAEAPWEDFKQLADLRQLDGESIFIICAAATGACDEEWCKQALSVLTELASTVTAECTLLLARADLLCFFGREVEALQVIQNLKVDDGWYETYLTLLSKSCLCHYLKSLADLSEQIKSVPIDSEADLRLPGLAKARADELLKFISDACATVEPLSVGFKSSL